MLNKFILQICTILVTITTIQKGIAQPNFSGIPDSIRTALKFKPVLTAALDGKNTFITGKGIPLRGLEFGLSFNNRISLMLGYYFLKHPIYGTSILNEGTIEEVNYYTRLKLHYISLVTEYTLVKKERWCIYLPVQAGIGKAVKDFYDSESLKIKRINRLFPVELSVTGNYRLWKFLGIGGGIGYRNAIGSNIIKDEDFNGITYSLGIKIWFRDLCYLLLPKCNYCSYL